MIQSLGDERLDRVVRDVVARAVRRLDPTRIWLFGSSVRRTNTRSSDVDLAFELSGPGSAAWAAFVMETEDELPALVELDLVDLATCAPTLIDEIKTTGQLVFERSP
ncbi:MAG TPA: nucleotidyltransferase domain-containing protein [Polyangia bacterium]